MKNTLIFGLQRSGTNFLEKLIKKNYQIKLLNSNRDTKVPFQKHFRLYNQKEISPHPKYKNDLRFDSFDALDNWFPQNPEAYLILSKDPYSWLISYQKWAGKCNWPPVKHHYIQEYNLFYGRWMQLSQETGKILFIRYIDLLTQPEKELKRIGDSFHLKPRHYFFQTTKLKNVPQSDTFSSEQFSYYTDKKYLSKYTQQELREINWKIDGPLMQQLGYSIQTGI